jgi:hypothetical protein
MQRKTDAYEHLGTRPRTREGPSGDSSSDDLGVPWWAAAIAVTVIVAPIVGFIVFFATLDLTLF